jgi:hypothetical protein
MLGGKRPKGWVPIDEKPGLTAAPPAQTARRRDLDVEVGDGVGGCDRMGVVEMLQDRDQ